MSGARSGLQAVLRLVFLVTCATATTIGLLLIWGIVPGEEASPSLVRILATCVVLAAASAFTMSANRLAAGRAPEEDR